MVTGGAGFIENMTDGYYRDYLEKKGDFSDSVFVCHPSDGARKIT